MAKPKKYNKKQRDIAYRINQCKKLKRNAYDRWHYYDIKINNLKKMLKESKN